MSFPCPEIEELSALWVKHKVMVRVDRNTLLSNKAYYPLVEFQISGENFSLFVDDEFSDFRKNYPLLNFCLVLRELDGYKYTSEYEVWCQERFFDSSDETIKEAFKKLK